MASRVAILVPECLLKILIRGDGELGFNCILHLQLPELLATHIHHHGFREICEFVKPKTSPCVTPSCHIQYPGQQQPARSRLNLGGSFRLADRAASSFVNMRLQI